MKSPRISNHNVISLFSAVKVRSVFKFTINEASVIV